MLMKPLRDKTQGQKSGISETATLVAPTKGWYVGSPMAASPVGTAFQLENAFPELDYVRMRGGSSAWSTGMVGVVRTLMTWTDGSASKIFALNAGAIYDVSSGGAVGGAVVSALSTTAIMSWVQFTGLGVQYLIAANGVQALQLFNGTTWGVAPAVTGLTGNQLSYVWTYKSRLYGIEATSQNVWYLGLNAVGGPATIFPMSPLLPRGGKLIAGSTWTVITGGGMKELWVVISSEGEVIVYDGGYPGVLDWTKVGTYRVSRPLGQNCLVSAGGELAIMTEDGIVPMSKVVTLDQFALQNQAVTVAIAPAWRDAVVARAGTSRDVWQIITWPLKSMVIVNLPHVNAADKTQFVANSRTGAWCRYVGWDANCWAVSGVGLGQLFYGTSDGRVMLAESGGMDDGASYTMTVFGSYTDLSKTDIGQDSIGHGAARKRIVMVRPRLQTNFAITAKVTINVDFDVNIPSAPSSSAGSLSGSGSLWNVAKWGIDKWAIGGAGVAGGGIFQYQQWVPVYADAAIIALITQVSVQSVSVPDIRLTSSDLMYETGNVFG